MLLKKKPTALLIIYNLSLRPRARTRNRNKPLQTIRTMLSGGSVSLYPSITPRLVGRVAAWISNIPTQPQASLTSNFVFFFTIWIVYRYWPGRQALLAFILLSGMQQVRHRCDRTSLSMVNYTGFGKVGKPSKGCWNDKPKWLSE